MEELSDLFPDPLLHSKRQPRITGVFPLNLWFVKRIEDQYDQIAQSAGLLGKYRALRRTPWFKEQRISVARAVEKLYPVPTGMTTADVESVIDQSERAAKYVRHMQIEHLLAVVTLFPELWIAAMRRAIDDRDPELAAQILDERLRAVERKETEESRLSILIVQHWIPLGLWLFGPKDAVRLLSSATGKMQGASAEAFKMAILRMGLRRQKGIAITIGDPRDGSRKVRWTQMFETVLNQALEAQKKLASKKS